MEDSFSNNKDVSVSVSEGSSVRKGPPLLGIDIYEEDEKGGSWLYETRL